MDTLIVGILGLGYVDFPKKKLTPGLPDERRQLIRLECRSHFALGGFFWPCQREIKLVGGGVPCRNRLPRGIILRAVVVLGLVFSRSGLELGTQGKLAFCFRICLLSGLDGGA